MDPDHPQSPKNYFLTWRYLLFWISSLLSNIGSWMQQVAQPWLVLSLSGSSLWVGLTSFAANIPGLLFTLTGGLLADRFDRKRVTLILQAIQFFVILMMVVLLITGLLRVWIIIVISFIVGLTDALCNPSLQTIVPSLVVKKDIAKAVSLNSTQFNLSRILGPVIAGIVIARFGIVACFSANAASYLPYFIAIWFIYPGKMDKSMREPIEIRPIEQFQEIRKLLKIRKVQLPLITVFVANLFCGPLITFCPVIVRDVFHLGIHSFGWAMTALGAGALIGASFTFIPLPAILGRKKLVAVAAIMQGLLVIAIALNHSFLLLCLLLFFAGTVQIIINISANAFLQENAADYLRGRIAGLFQLAMFSGLSIGALLTGLLIAKFSIAKAFCLNGSIAAVLQAWVSWKKLHNPTGK